MWYLKFLLPPLSLQVVGSLPQPAPAQPVTDRDSASWIAFDESGTNEENSGLKAPPYLLLGYSNGIQVWDIRDSNV